MRRIVVAFASLVLVLSACTSNNTESAQPSSSASGADACAKDSLNLIKPGQLTVGTDNPSYPPWIVANTPENGKGFEGSLAYAVADRLGFAKDEVRWVDVPFNSAGTAGPKNFDFDINNITVTPERATVVTFSDGYYDLSQALVTMADSPLASATTLADLKGYKYGAQIGTTSLTFIAQTIAPGPQPAVYDTTNDAKQALVNGQVDGLILDLPTAYYVSSVQIPGSKLVGQFEPQEYLGMLFEKDNPLVTCVNEALAGLKADGTLETLQQKWLADYLSVPVIK
jgi:polar amino acid transport system substrate-binding protein